MVKVSGQKPAVKTGDLLFGGFLLAWSGSMYMAAKQKGPIEIYDFEKPFLAVDEEGLPNNDDFGWTVQDRNEIWIRELFWVPAACSIMYFVMLRSFEPIMASMERPGWLKPLTFFWNLFFSLASSFFAWRILLDTRDWEAVPELICTKACRRPLSCVYVWGFCLSKIPELFDTLWLILAKKNVRFLHWFHHITVMWFCWMAISWVSYMGWAFCVMNLSVHSIMYMWYALAAGDGWIGTGLRPGKRLSQLVTVLQITQMICGTAICLYVNFTAGCENDTKAARSGLVMYLIYLALFVKFFVQAYCMERPKRKSA